MKRLITQEVAQAIHRGEINYAETLQDMELVRTSDNVSMRPYALSANQIEARNFIIRRLRGAA